MAIDTATIMTTIMSFVKSHWLELLIVLGIAWVVKNWQIILIGVIAVVAFSHYGYDLSSLTDMIMSYITGSSGGLPFNLDIFLNESVNQTLITNITGG